MEWWQCFVGAGTVACLASVVVMLLTQRDMLMFAQVAKYEGVWVMIGRFVAGLAFQFVLWGVILGTPVWFGYWLIS